MGKKLKNTFVLLSLIFLPIGFLFSQEPSQKEEISIQIWPDLDPFPGFFGDSESNLKKDSEQKSVSHSENNIKSVKQNSADAHTNAFTASATAEDLTPFSFAINRTKEIAPLLLGGMIDGWTFDYTPSDKARNVGEYFEFAEVRPFNAKINHISYKTPQVKDGKLISWANCSRTQSQQLAYERWASITHPKISGHGASPVEQELEGIKKACGEAVKNAVREYWRKIEKNKPKEICGTVLLIGNPRIYISEGQYVVDLDFFLETDRIVLYSYY